MPHLLVIRFGALGDLCLLAWSLARLARARPTGDCDLTLVTKSTFADLMHQVPGVAQVAPLSGPRLRDLSALARKLRPLAAESVIDAHNKLRSRLLLAMLGRQPRRRLAKDTAARLRLLFFRHRSPALTRSMLQRFDDLFAQYLLAEQGKPAGDTAPAGTELAGTAPDAGQPGPSGLDGLHPPLASLATATAASGQRLGLAPGARWDAKRWPDAHFASFLRQFREQSTAPVSIFLGPQELFWFESSELARAARETPDVQVHQGVDLVPTATALAACTTLLTNDSGLLHLSEAVGTPVLALFGPTVREFGYFPCLPRSHVLQNDLYCRPCSRNGRRPCWRLDQACLASISSETVLAELREMVAWREGARTATAAEENHYG